MITVGMMIFIILIGISGFFACLGIFIEVLKIIRDLFGRRVFLVVLVLCGYWFIKAGMWENNLEKETVEDFMSSWQEASKDLSNGMARTDMWGQCDFVRARNNYSLPNDPYFINSHILTRYSPIESLSSETIPLASDLVGGYEEGMYKVKVFTTTAYFENGFKNDIKFWVTGDNFEIVKMSF